MYIFMLFVVCTVASVRSQCNCDYPSFFNLPSPNDWNPMLEYYAVATVKVPPPKFDSVQSVGNTQNQIPLLETAPSTVNRFSPSSNVGSLARELANMQQKQMTELYCLEVLDKFITTKWQEDINKITVTDLGYISSMMKIPPFKSLYSNPESEWIQDEGMALTKLDGCVRNLVSKVAPRLDQEEIQCLNRMYLDYFVRENRTARLEAEYIKETSREQLPFRSFYTYYDLTQLMFDNKNIDALDDELRVIYEDMTMFYIKTEEDKTKQIFIIDQECEWKDARYLKEATSEEMRYKRFGEQVKSHVNRYLAAEILQKWVPGVIIPEFRYNIWVKARNAMERQIQQTITVLQKEKRDAQNLCLYAAEMAEKFFQEQKEILFDKSKHTPLSMELRTRLKYGYVVALEGVLTTKNDDRLPRAKLLVEEFKEGHYCLTNFVRMVENHQRYTIATAFVNEMLPYGHTYCHVKEDSAGLIHPRYCKCQGTLCEEFGLATVRRERYQLVLLPNGTYSVATNSTYRIDPQDELIGDANERIAQQKWNTWWREHQKTPA